jgi:hypothetical protein
LGGQRRHLHRDYHATEAIIADAFAYNTLIVNNRIADFIIGIGFSNAGKYRDNLALDTSIAYSGGTDEGNNK